MRMLKFALAIAIAGLPSLAWAQSNPGWTQDQRITPAQWNAEWSSKQDTLGFTPLNSAGGTVTGRLVTAPSGATTAGLNLTPGNTPASPANGDIWATALGVFVQINGNTVSIGASSGSVSSVGLSLPNVLFSVSGSPVTLSGTLTGSLISQTANTFFAAPNGSNGSPTFRTIANADFPSGFVNCGTGLTGGALPGGGTCAVDKATASNYYAGTANKIVAADVIYPSEVAVTYGATTAFDFSTFINASVTMTGNISTMNVSNVIAGKAGTIRFIHTSTVTISFNSVFKFAGGSAPSPTSGSATDVLNYNCVTTTFCQANFVNDVR